MPTQVNQDQLPVLSKSEPVQEYLHIFRRRRLVVIQSFMVCVALGTVVTLLTRPVYQATSELLVDAPSYSLNTNDQTNPLSGILAISQPQDVSTQVKQLQSQQLLDQVAHDVGKVAFTVEDEDETNVISVVAESNSVFCAVTCQSLANP